MPIKQRIEYEVCELVYRFLHVAAPIYLAAMYTAAVSVSVS